MNKKYLWGLVTVMLLSMFGLIAIQVYWITNSYNIKEKNFNYQVNKALSETIKTLETTETIFEISNEVFQLSENKDSVIERSIRNFDQSINKYKNDIHTIGNKSLVTISGNKLISLDSSLNISTQKLSKKQQEDDAFLKISSEEVKDIIQNKVNNKTLFVEKIVNQILNYNEDIIQRLSKTDVRKLIYTNLRDHGIDINFEYAIKSEGERKFSSKAFEAIPSKIYAKRLFPNNLFHDNDYLELYIPGKTQFIVKTMIPIIFITIALTLLIIGVVIFNFIIILRQKRLGDIKNDFVNNLTHELKTPIATISLAGQMLSDKDIRSTESNVERYAQIIGQESNRLTKQVEKVLQIALIDKGELKLKNVKINLNQFIEKICHPFVLKVERFDGKLSIDLPQHTVWIYADELHLSNVINNLLDNALKYKLTIPIIKIRLEELDKYIKIEVVDNGMGIHKIDQLRIFEKFYRVEGGNIHNIKGFGLGLSYVKKIIDLYNGKIEVKSKIDQGSTFTIQLPKPEFKQQNY